MTAPSLNNAQPPGQGPFAGLAQPSTPPPGTPPMLPVNPWGNDPFPTPEGDSEDLAFHTPTFREVARKLRADLAKYRAAAKHLNTAGGLQASDLGQWAAGQDLYATAQRTHQSVAEVLEAFVASYEELIHKIERSAASYDSAEDETAAAIRELLKAADGGPTSAND